MLKDIEWQQLTVNLPPLGGGGGRDKICDGCGAFIFFKLECNGDIAGGWMCTYKQIR